MIVQDTPYPDGESSINIWLLINYARAILGKF